MPLNANHIFEDLGEIKCSIIEKDCSDERVSFLKNLLEFNGFTVIVVKSPPAKAVATGTAIPVDHAISLPEKFTVGVTDLSFNPMNAIYNRELKTNSGLIVTRTYWKQLDTKSDETSWYWKQ